MDLASLLAQGRAKQAAGHRRRFVNSFTASSDASLWLRKTLGIMSVPELMLTWISPSCTREGVGLQKDVRAEKRSAAACTEERLERNGKG